MADPSMQPPEQAPQAPGQDPSQGDSGSPMGKIAEQMTQVGQALPIFGQLAEQMNAPPEAIQALQVAIESYNKFLSLTQKALGVEGTPDAAGPQQGPRAPMGQQSDMASGAKNVVPADQMNVGRK